MPITPMRIVGIVCIIGGAILLWNGWERYNSVGSSFGRALGGGPSNQTLMLLIGGAVAVVVGIVLTVRR